MVRLLGCPGQDPGELILGLEVDEEGEKRTLWVGWRRELWEEPVCKLDPCATRAVWKVKFAQSCPTLCDPMDYTVHGIVQARILQWVAFPFSRGSSQPRDRTQAGPLHFGQILYQLSS